MLSVLLFCLKGGMEFSFLSAADCVRNRGSSSRFVRKNGEIVEDRCLCRRWRD